MIKFEHRDDEKTVLEIEGSLRDVLADSTLMITMVYESILEKNPSMAEQYRKIFKQAISDDLPFDQDKAMKKLETRNNVADAFIKVLEDILCS